MYEVVGVKFPSSGKTIFCNSKGLKLTVGTWCIVETPEGEVLLGEVVIEPQLFLETEISAPLGRVIRAATSEDLAKKEKRAIQEKEFFKICQTKVDKLNLPMKIVAVEYSFNKEKVTFFFTSSEKVDFRELAAELAKELSLQIEFRQIGVRSQAKLLGGCGACGRELCCSVFKHEFESISIKMAREQYLFLNPAKLTGVCGKLKCCLAYEYEFYEQTRKKLPPVGTKVVYQNEEGKVISHQILKERIVVQFEEAGIRTLSPKEVLIKEEE
jgi:cell fate regulator YaaT (PSP1 superfamily)